MALIDEQIVEEWLNRQNFFTMRGIKSGIDEIDLLAVRHNNDNTTDYWHAEVQVSFRPIGYIGGDTSARKRTEQEIRDGVVQWVDKKFVGKRKVDRRNDILPNAKWRFMLVHGEVRDSAELEIMKELGIDLVPYKQVLNELSGDKLKTSSSIATSITEILNYIKQDK
jgi:hypothetical protein